MATYQSIVNSQSDQELISILDNIPNSRYDNPEVTAQGIINELRRRGNNYTPQWMISDKKTSASTNSVIVISLSILALFGLVKLIK